MRRGAYFRVAAATRLSGAFSRSLLAQLATSPACLREEVRSISAVCRGVDTNVSIVLFGEGNRIGPRVLGTLCPDSTAIRPGYPVGTARGHSMQPPRDRSRQRATARGAGLQGIGVGARAAEKAAIVVVSLRAGNQRVARRYGPREDVRVKHARVPAGSVGSLVNVQTCIQSKCLGIGISPGCTKPCRKCRGNQEAWLFPPNLITCKP